MRRPAGQRVFKYTKTTRSVFSPIASAPDVTQVSHRAAREIKFLTYLSNLSNLKPGHTTGRSGRDGARRSGEREQGWVGRDVVGSFRPGNNPSSCSPAYRIHCSVHLSNTKPEHATGGSGRGARRGGRASGRIRCQQNWSLGKHKSLVPSKGSKKRCLNVFTESRTNKILYKQARRVQHPIPRAGRVEAHGEVAGRDRAGLFANRTVRLENNFYWHSRESSLKNVFI